MSEMPGRWYLENFEPEGHVTMPERVRRYGLQPAEMDVDPREGDWVRYNDYAALESRLREAEAAKRDAIYDLARQVDRADGTIERLEELVLTLRAEHAALQADLAALVPLLHYFVEYVEDGRYDEEDGMAPPHDCDFASNPESGYCEFHDKWGAARAILARGEGAGPPT